MYFMDFKIAEGYVYFFSNKIRLVIQRDFISNFYNIFRKRQNLLS